MECRLLREQRAGRKPKPRSAARSSPVGMTDLTCLFGGDWCVFQANAELSLALNTQVSTPGTALLDLRSSWG